jgi:hypothetical protein
VMSPPVEMGCAPGCRRLLCDNETRRRNCQNPIKQRLHHQLREGARSARLKIMDVGRGHDRPRGCHSVFACHGSLSEAATASVRVQTLFFVACWLVLRTSVPTRLCPSSQHNFFLLASAFQTGRLAERSMRQQLYSAKNSGRGLIRRHSS